MIPCELCDMPSTDTHHVFGGNHNRHTSEEFGLVIRLCRRCHAAVHQNADLALALKKRCQTRFEETHTRDEFMRHFGRSYL